MCVVISWEVCSFCCLLKKLELTLRKNLAFYRLWIAFELIFKINQKMKKVLLSVFFAVVMAAGANAQKFA
ncbi:MAG: hypothetical protein LBF79_06335, partial [Dysgonamonadaceae bacterium]|nr:hypothetical protein [Dysgonamonadaceae bacterium]